MHKGHLTGCALMLAVAFGFIMFTGGTATGLGLVAVALVCPLAMILAMKLIMGDSHKHSDSVEPVVEAQPDSR